jgi:hypothetical protein
VSGYCTSAVEIAKRRIRSPAEIQPWQRLDLEDLKLSQAQCEQAVQ